MQKGVISRAGPMWMRRGTQAQVVEPRGPTRAPMWRRGDRCAIFVCIYILYMVIVHISIRMSDLS